MQNIRACSNSKDLFKYATHVGDFDTLKNLQDIGLKVLIYSLCHLA